VGSVLDALREDTLAVGGDARGATAARHVAVVAGAPDAPYSSRMPLPVTEHVVESSRHTTAYLACGPADGPPLIFVHGWPELSTSWRHQIPAFGALGFRCVAPDMRGYGRSSVPGRHADYALPHIAADMLELLDSLGAERAVWVGHDWGSPVVWSLASHHPERCVGVASLCVPYLRPGFTLKTLVPLVDRRVYPVDRFPAGQWDYQLFYEESFARASAAFEANVRNTVKALFRTGNPAAVGKPARTAMVRQAGGWFGGGAAPDVPLDTNVLTEQDLATYVAALERNGFFGPDSWYMNHAENGDYAARSKHDGRIALPVLFVHATYDTTCETMASSLAEPMRRDCADLTEAVVPSGHWMAQEQPVAVNAALEKWLATRLADFWPR
jgi:pimeloyl-ACP methyl ester carboxylesterase